MAASDRIDGYAAAIIEVAAAEDALERVADELFRVARLFESSGDLREALTDRRIPTDRKQGIVDDLLGERALPLTVGLLSFVVAVGRSGDLAAIADRVAGMAAAAADRVIAEVRSAVELDEDQVSRLAESLGRATGKDVDVKVVVDPAVIGGIVARVGDTVIDGSVRHRLDELRTTLQGR
jgi:F-type H+-transporting ATPase subunit delta